jgi:FtsH-binding integral membrane protein
MIPSTSRPAGRALAVAALADLVCVLVFVTIGRSSHEEGITLTGLLTTGWPFWLGVAGGYAGVVAFRLAPASPPGAAMVLIKTLVIGMILRNVVQHDGTPFSFVVVATVFLALTLAGWRTAARFAVLRRMRTASPNSPHTLPQQTRAGSETSSSKNTDPAGPHEASRPESLRS